MLVSGRNNVKEVLNINNLKITKAILQENFNEEKIINLIKQKHIPIKYECKVKLDTIAKNNHQGVILIVEDYLYSSVEDIIKDKDNCTIIILDHIEDPHNFGAIIRTVEASGIDGIIIPINRTVSVNETVMKTSVGTLYNVKIAQVNNLTNTIKKLKKEGFWIYGADMNGKDYREIKYPNKTVLIIGNEGRGLSRIVKEETDEIISIPMYGKVNSLNASVATGVLAYGIIKR